MPEFLKGSKVLCFFAGLFLALKNSYANSRFKSLVGKTALCFKNSLIARALSAYFNKNAYFEYSLSYRFILWLVKIFDMPISAIGRLFTRLTKGSGVAQAAAELAESNAKDRLLLAGVLCVFVSVGYAIGLLAKGGAAVDFMPSAIVFALAVVTFAVANSLVWIKNSLIYKFFAWLGLVK